MITDAIIFVLIQPVLLILTLFDSVGINISLPTAFFEGANVLLNGLGYFIPVIALAPIFLTVIILKNARILWALVIRIKSFIPTMGS